MIGRVLSHYEVFEKLGEGGMGYADLTQYEELREHPQFQELLRRINFPEL
jgi:hypothetical protein